MASGSWDFSEDGTHTASSTVRWRGRNHVNFIAGRSKLRALPVVIHLLPDDIDWFSEVPSQLRFQMRRIAPPLLPEVLRYSNTRVVNESDQRRDGIISDGRM